MKLEQSFEVEAPLEQVWAALIDVERVAPNLPGAAVTGRNDDGTYNGTFTIKIGPTTASYTGKLEMQNVDEGAHSATMYAQGSDRRGQGGASATISSRLTALNGRTRVEVVTDYHITGRLARFGRGGMIEDISERLLREFAGRLQSSLAGAPPTVDHQADVAEDEAAVGAQSEQPTSETVMTPAVEAEAAAPAPPPTEAAESAEPAESAESAEEPEAPGLPGPEPGPPEPEPGPPEPPTGAEPVMGAEPPMGAEPAMGEAGPPPPLPAEPPTEAGPPPPPPEAGPPPPPPEAGPPPPPPPPPADSAPPVQGLSLVGGVLLSRIKRNPAPLIGAIAGLVLLRLIFRKR